MHHFSVCLPDEMDATEIVFLDHRNASAMQMHLMEITGTMARDSQRRKAELNMWHKLKKQDTGPKHGVRPANPNDCTDRRHAELHRRDVGRELSAVMTHLTATSLVDNLTPRAAPGDDTPDSFEDVSYDAAVLAKVRDLNHTAQRLVRLHAKWDKRVVALGGPRSLPTKTPHNIFLAPLVVFQKHARPQRPLQEGSQPLKLIQVRESMTALAPA